MANLVKHMTMTDGTTVDITANTYLLTYRLNTNAYRVCTHYIYNDLTILSIRNLVTNETVNTIADIDEANLIVCIGLNENNPTFYTIVKKGYRNGRIYNLEAIYTRDSAGAFINYIFTANLNSSTYKLTSVKFSLMSGVQVGATDRLLLIDAQNNVTVDGVNRADFFNTGLVMPRIYYIPATMFATPITWYVLDSNNVKLQKAINTIFNDYDNDFSTLLTIVYEYRIGTSTTTFYLKQTIRNNNNSLDITYGTFSFGTTL